MDTTIKALSGNVDWEEPGLTLRQHYEAWVGRSVDFEKRPFRPRRSRRLKHVGAMIVLASIALLFGAKPVVEHYWPGFMETSAVNWQDIAIWPPWCALCFALGLGGLWLCNLGASRRR